jgi:hypothetical protein
MCNNAAAAAAWRNSIQHSRVNELCNAGAVKKKMEKNVNLDQRQFSPNHTVLTKLLDHSFMCKELVSTMNRTF